LFTGQLDSEMKKKKKKKKEKRNEPEAAFGRFCHSPGSVFELFPSWQRGDRGQDLPLHPAKRSKERSSWVSRCTRKEKKKEGTITLPLRQGVGLCFVELDDQL